MKEPLTDKQSIILDTIKWFISTNGFSPSIRELCALCNLSSSATMWVHLQNLKAKGYIDFDERKMRTIRVL